MIGMGEDKVRELFGRYQPVGPLPDLRERALRASTHPLRTWPWAAAAAALLAAAIGLQVATSRLLARVAAPAVSLSVDALAAAMGGDEAARAVARLIVEEQMFRVRMTRAHVGEQTVEDALNVN
jgi:hypothetical protein